MEKDLLLSKTTWGAIIAMIAMIAMYFGYDIGDQDMLVNVVFGIVGGFYSLYGRYRSVTRITSVAGIPLAK